MLSENQAIGQLSNHIDKDFKFVKNLDKFDEDVKPENPVVIGEAQPNYPLAIATDSYDNIYVLDSESSVQKFDNNGDFVSKWGGYGNEIGKLNNPQDFVIDSKDYVYVADSYNYRIQKFDTEGNYINSWNIANFHASTPTSITMDNQDRIKVGFYLPGVTGYFDVDGNEISLNSTNEFKDFGLETGHLTVLNSTGYKFVINDTYESNDYGKIQIFAPVSNNPSELTNEGTTNESSSLPSVMDLSDSNEKTNTSKVDEIPNSSLPLGVTDEV